MNLLLACALALLDHRSPDVCRARSLPATLPATIEAVRTASAAFDVPAPIVLKVIYRESHFDVQARGSLGEIGLMQLKRHRGAVPEDLQALPRVALEEPELNVWLGVQYLAHVSLKCPNHFLSRYNGGGCRVTRYSQRIRSAGRDSKPKRKGLT